MAAPFGKLAYLYVGTGDLDRDLEYYTKILGGKLLWNYHEFGAKVASVRLSDGPQYLLADHRHAPSVLPIFEVEDLKTRIAEDAVWYVPGSTPISGEHRGHAAIFAYVQKLVELSGGTFRAELVDILASDMHAVALASATGTRGDQIGRAHV